jgi:protein TonB
MDSTTEGPSSVSAPASDAPTMGPTKPGPRAERNRPVPAAPAGRGARGPVSDLDVGRLPDVDTEACGRSVKYPREAEALGIEGDVLLRVELDDTGRVADVRVLKGLGHGLDQAAAAALRQTCRFTAALDKNGARVPYVIQKYTFHFELPK